jgi:hypothetical protein
MYMRIGLCLMNERKLVYISSNSSQALLTVALRYSLKNNVLHLPLK